jgi:hypothetical protein
MRQLMRLEELLFTHLGYDERRLILDRLGLRDAQALSCTNTTYRRRLSPAQLDLLSVDLDAYSWANRALQLVDCTWCPSAARVHGGIALAMHLPAAAAVLEWTCCIEQLRKSQLGSSWTMFGLEHLDDNGWHMHLVSDRGCAYADGKLMARAKIPELKSGSLLRFVLDLEGKGVLKVSIDGGAPYTMSGARGLVPGRSRASQSIQRLYARAHIWDSQANTSHLKRVNSKATSPAGRDEMRPQGIVRLHGT